MKRGDIVTIALQGDYGKPRPAVVIQSDLIPSGDSVLVCLVTSGESPGGPFRRHDLKASPQTGLRVPSQVMVDKVFAIRRVRCGPKIGEVDRDTLRRLTGKLALLIGIED